MILTLLVVPFSIGITHFAFAATKQTDQHQLYEQIVAEVSIYNPNFTIEYYGGTQNLSEELEKAMHTIREDYPYYYENISKWHASYSYTTMKASITFTINYLTTFQQEQYVDEQIVLLANQLFTPDMSDYEKIKVVHDYVVLNTEYSSDTQASQYTTYSLIKEGKAVCQGYAFFVYRMLQEADVPVKYVKGYAGDQLHGWNLVYVNNHWYHLDTTWDDPLPNNNNEIKYKYFLLSDEQIEKTHTWERESYPKALKEKNTLYNMRLILREDLKSPIYRFKYDFVMRNVYVEPKKLLVY